MILAHILNFLIMQYASFLCVVQPNGLQIIFEYSQFQKYAYIVIQVGWSQILLQYSECVYIYM